MSSMLMVIKCVDTNDIHTHTHCNCLRGVIQFIYISNQLLMNYPLKSSKMAEIYYGDIVSAMLLCPFWMPSWNTPRSSAPVCMALLVTTFIRVQIQSPPRREWRNLPLALTSSRRICVLRVAITLPYASEMESKSVAPRALAGGATPLLYCSWLQSG